MSEKKRKPKEEVVPLFITLPVSFAGAGLTVAELFPDGICPEGPDGEMYLISKVARSLSE